MSFAQYIIQRIPSGKLQTISTIKNIFENLGNPSVKQIKDGMLNYEESQNFQVMKLLIIGFHRVLDF